MFNLHGTSRPEGVAENWLTAVGDTTRKGVEADARKRAEKIGGVSIGEAICCSSDTDGKAAFADLEVGKAVNGRAIGRRCASASTRVTAGTPKRSTA